MTRHFNAKKTDRNEVAHHWTVGRQIETEEAMRTARPEPLWVGFEHPPCCYITLPSGFGQMPSLAPSAGQKLLRPRDTKTSRGSPRSLSPDACQPSPASVTSNESTILSLSLSSKLRSRSGELPFALTADGASPPTPAAPSRRGRVLN